LEKNKQGIWTANKHRGVSNVKALEKWREKTVVKISGKEIKAVNKFVYLKCVVEKNVKIQNDINERTGNASQLYQIAKSLLWTKDVDRRCKIMDMY
jgi:hypothetical protein